MSNQFTYTAISATLLLSFAVSLLGLYGYKFHEQNLTWEEGKHESLHEEYKVCLILTNLVMGFLVDVFGGARSLLGMWVLTILLLYTMATDDRGEGFQAWFSLLVLVNALVVPSVHDIIRKHNQCERLLYTTVFIFASRHMMCKALFEFALQHISLPTMCYLLIILCGLSIMMLYKLFLNHWDFHFRDINIFDLPAFIFSYRQLLMTKHFWIYLFWNLFTGCFVFGGRLLDDITEDGAQWFETGVLGGLMIAGAIYLLLNLKRRIIFIYGCIGVATTVFIVSSFFYSSIPPSSYTLVLIGFFLAVPHYIAPTLLLFKLEKHRLGNCYSFTQGATHLFALFFSLTLGKMYQFIPERTLMYMAVACLNVCGAIYLSYGQSLMKKSGTKKKKS